ncbi:MAG: iron-containing alcohol dehydrogenase [Chloroflexi bacterium]|nr:iron-containing alcohol dehydrogenase [Chloroflexota bacterium]
MSYFEKARGLIRGFKGDRYAFGAGALARSGELAAQLGKTAVLIYTVYPGVEKLVEQVKGSLESAGMTVLGDLIGAAPNAPREDVFRLGDGVAELKPEVIVVTGGGSTIDAAKAASVLATLGGPIARYFGTGLVTAALTTSGKKLIPVVAVQTASSSGAHLTKYSNITDLKTGQKKLIVDEAIVPARAVFQYDITTSMPPGFTADGALDGIAHLIEVLYSAVGQGFYQKAAEIAAVGVRLIVNHLERAVAEPTDLEAREALGLGTDLGGYAIMIGGTSGAHLTSFSLVDILSHGRACAITNPYYTVFFAPAIEGPLKLIGGIYKDAGLTQADIDSLSGRELGVAVAEAMIALSERIGFPTTLSEVEGFTEGHIERALTAARDPQLKMKLQNMPVPLTAEMVDEYMRPILEAARDGDLNHIKNVTARR